MKRMAWIGAWGLMVAALVLGSPASGQVLLDWGPNCFGWETDYSGHISNPGSQLTICGKIDAFYTPLDGLDPDAMEYTFVFDGLTSLGTTVVGGVIFETDYDGGVFRIYQDPTPDFEFGVNPPNGTAPATFMDGELILEGTFSGFSVTLIDMGTTPATGNATGNWVMTGGTLYDLVAGCYGPFLGSWTDDDEVVPIPAGYTNHFDGKYDIEYCPPVPTDETSWGVIKRMYR